MLCSSKLLKAGNWCQDQIGASEIKSTVSVQALSSRLQAAQGWGSQYLPRVCPGATAPGMVWCGLFPVRGRQDQHCPGARCHHSPVCGGTFGSLRKGPWNSFGCKGQGEDWSGTTCEAQRAGYATSRSKDHGKSNAQDGGPGFRCSSLRASSWFDKSAKYSGCWVCSRDTAWREMQIWWAAYGVQPCGQSFFGGSCKGACHDWKATGRGFDPREEKANRGGFDLSDSASASWSTASASWSATFISSRWKCASSAVGGADSCSKLSCSPPFGGQCAREPLGSGIRSLRRFSVCCRQGSRGDCFRSSTAWPGTCCGSNRHLDCGGPCRYLPSVGVTTFLANPCGFLRRSAAC